MTSGQSDLDSHAANSAPDPPQYMEMEQECNTPSLDASPSQNRPAGRKSQISMRNNEKMRERDVINAKMISDRLELRTKALQKKNALLV